jgi:membrane fusion protein, multidrug efflux system
MKSILFMLALSVWLAACNKETAPPEKTVRPALTRIAGDMPVENDLEYGGEIRARHEPLLGFRIGGKIIERRVGIGMKVKAGDVLARLDSSDAVSQANAAEAQYRLALSDAKRYRELRKSGFVSQAALDAKETALKSARAEAALARNQTDYAVLRAGRDGVIQTVLADAGQVVEAGQAVMRLADLGENEAAFEIPEAQLSQFHLGDAAEVRVGDLPPLKGRIRELSASADPASRTYPARVAFDDPTNKIALGMSARVLFRMPASDALLIPLSAIYQQGKQAAVWVVSGNHSVSLRPVSVSVYRDDGAIISGGLKAGERIVVAGVHRLSEGEIIQPVDSPQ